ncbi:hypothetical protein AzCIB_1841 [Azoarcus sp. CIB]|uniref:lipopolysaccharide biosynthesis protein n=1 Tax=Aromatoleum sp. (strain CIB) TaxID=198107 RepID=UPI00067ABAD8|nr:hypothetical protein [Azoarcus sp. CIB]AKU11736.1 hypothetical protein AzCIB_1841 [Azoarcus sp. CIB]
MGRSHYSVERARIALVHFVVGRGAAAVTGVLGLLLIVRAMPIGDYGIYVSVLAFVEIYYLATGFGLSAIAQRYVPDFRIKASGDCFARFVKRVYALRVWSATAASVITGWIVSTYWETLLDQRLFDDAAFLGAGAALFLIVGVLYRYLDELFGSLLLQAWSQSLAVLRNAGKALAAALLLANGQDLDVGQMLIVELAVCSVSALIGSLVLAAYLRKRDAGGDESYHVPGMWAVALRFYGVQVLGQVYGANVLKLLVAKTLGFEYTAVLGFAQSLTDMLRNYLPAQLLIGWIRPLMVSRYVATRDLGQLAMVAVLALKSNLLGILFLLVFFVVGGDNAGALLSGGKYPEAGALLSLMMVLVGFQTAHLMLSLIAVTLERPNANLIATVLACAGLPMAYVLGHAFGLTGVIAGLIAAEFIWIAAVWFLLCYSGFRLPVVWQGLLKVVLWGGTLAVGAAYLKQPTMQVVQGAGFALAFLALMAWLKPLEAEERSVIARFVPPRLIFF